MSGSFVQRGDCAVADKWTRTHAALLGGADLILELPVYYSLAVAQLFAFGAVATLNALGCVDFLSFGIEADSCLLYTSSVSTPASFSGAKYSSTTSAVTGVSKCPFSTSGTNSGHACAYTCACGIAA